MIRARASLLTSSGRSAVAVVAVAGENAVAAVDQHFHAANRRLLCDQMLGRIIYGHWGGDGGEDLVVSLRGPEKLEIHCHGGYQSAPQILADLRASGCALVDWQTWLSGQAACPIATEAQLALAQTSTLRAATILLDQYHGALRKVLVEIVTELENDFCSQAKERLRHLLRRTEVGLHLTRPWRVAIGGRPNVGKSSLLNALAGFQRAIVFDQPGTTRDVVTVATAFDGWPVELSDTAGLHESTEELEIAGIALAREQLNSADLILWLLDATTLGQNIPLSLASTQAHSVGVELEAARPLIVVNKIDLVAWDHHVVGVSATSGLGLEQLLKEIATRLVPEPPPQGAAVPFTTSLVDALQTALDACEQRKLGKALQALRQIYVQRPAGLA